METTELQKTIVKVSGMDCGDETAAIKKALLSLNGISAVEPNLVSAQIVITHDSKVSRQEIIKKINSTGVSVDEAEASGKTISKFNRRSFLVLTSGFLLVTGLGLGFFDLITESVQKGIYLFSILLGGALIAPKAFRALKTFTLDMNVLMMIATVGALAIGEFSEASAVVFLFAFAELLESFSLERARKSIQSLLKLVPEMALVKANSTPEYSEVPIDQVAVDDVLLVRSGARIPLDGIVTFGRASINQAPITGESLPVEKSIGDKVLAGTVNEEGSIEVKVTQDSQHTKLSQIIRLIEEAQKQKAPTQRFVDKFATYYTPFVLALAVGILLIPPIFFNGDWSTWIYRALVMLVIACPCALVIATPVSIVSGLTAMAKRGVLIKGGAGLEAIGKLKALAVDKTGTITEGVPKILKIYSMNGHTEDQILSIAASIDMHSTHPLARAVVSEAIARKLTVTQSIGYQSTSGRGAEAVIDDHFYFVGNHKFAHDNAVCSTDLEALLASIEDQAQSVVIVGHRPHAGCTGQVMGVLGLGDAIRTEAKQAILALHSAGIQSVVMLSGDNQRTVDAISKQVGIDEAFGDLLPSDKVLKIKELKDRYGSVAMIGDGINDAPAMASANLGIAMGASGTDTAIETSDVTLMQDQLLGIADAIIMGKKTLRVIWFNTAFALTTKLLFLGLSISGHTSLWLAIAADTGATLLVIANSLRLLR